MKGMPKLRAGRKGCESVFVGMMLGGNKLIRTKKNINMRRE